MFKFMKNDLVEDRLKELEDNPTKVKVDDEIIRLIEEIRNEQNESKIRQMVSNIKDLAEASNNLNTIERRVDFRRSDDTIPTIAASALSFVFLVIFENRHVLPKAINWIKRI